MTALNVALIGQGFMGKAHSNAYAQVGHFFPELRKVRRKVVCGRNRERLAAFAKTWEWEQVETDWRRIVERDDIDIVDICTPNALHAEMAVAAAEAGKMALCEKPAANNAVEAAAMAEAAKGVPNMVWFNYRRVPAVELARQLVHEGKLGRIFQYRAGVLAGMGKRFHAARGLEAVESRGRLGGQRRPQLALDRYGDDDAGADPRSLGDDGDLLRRKTRPEQTGGNVSG